MYEHARFFLFISNFPKEKFFKILQRTKKIRYIHLLGGETILMPAFEKILKFLINNDMHKTVTLGFTTNLTVYPKKIIELLNINIETIMIEIISMF